MLDSTIQTEAGKNSDNPQGLTKKQKAEQYSKSSNKDERVNVRKSEMFDVICLFSKKLKNYKKNIINKIAGNQRLTRVCGKVDAYQWSNDYFPCLVTDQT